MTTDAIRPYGAVPSRRRAVSLTLAIAAHLLIVWLLLLKLSPPVEDRAPSGGALKTFSVTPAPAAKASAAKAAPKRAAKAAERQPVERTPPPPPAPPDLPVPNPQSAPKLAGGNLFDAMDISKLANHRGEGRGDDGDARGDSHAPYGPGEGPGGARMYDAEWQREPTSAELNGYLPPRGVEAGSWTLIACLTAPDYRVVNCRVLDESPPGSGLGRAMREAAWQFRVLPPRLGGKSLVGAWVRIHIGWTAGGLDVRR